VKSALDKGMLLNQARDGKLIKEAGFAHGCPDMPRQSGPVQGDVKGKSLKPNGLLKSDWGVHLTLRSLHSWVMGEEGPPVLSCLDLALSLQIWGGIGCSRGQ
jgi:hypothetical protein